MNPGYLLVVGAVTSLLMTELIGLSPGGVIVPGYMALYFGSPLRLAATLVDAAIALGAVRLISRYAILFGRRKYAAFLLAGFLARTIVERVLPALAPELPLMAAAGWLIPGIIASEADRQGPLRTLAALAAASALARLVWIGLS